MLKELKSFTPLNIDEVRRLLTKTLKDFENDYGVSINLGRLTYNRNEARAKVTVRTKGAEDVKIIETSTLLKGKGIQIGDKFRHGGGIFTITDFKPRNFKYPYIATGANGRSYKFQASSINENTLIKK